MKKWIKGLAFQHKIQPITAALAPSANGQPDIVLPSGSAVGAALPVVAGGQMMMQDNKQLQ